jgi:glycosyltransferase involved in cell wall biosynthesis
VGGTPQFYYAKELGLPPQRIFTGYNAVDNQFWQEQAEVIRKNGIARQQARLPDKFFLTVCRFIPKKNVSGLLRAYSRYRSLAGATAWHLVICGSGELEPQISSQINTSGLERFVHLPGYKKAEEMPVFYGSAGAFVLPSSHAEQWGLVVNEAMASGLPVLVSKICGCAHDLVQDGVNGFTFDPLDVEGLARLMLRMSSGQVDLKAMGAASREIISHWTPGTFARNLLRAIKSARMNRARTA